MRLLRTGKNHPDGSASHALSKEISDPLDERRRLFESSLCPPSWTGTHSPFATRQERISPPRRYNHNEPHDQANHSAQRGFCADESPASRQRPQEISQVFHTPGSTFRHHPHRVSGVTASPITDAVPNASANRTHLSPPPRNPTSLPQPQRQRAIRPQKTEAERQRDHGASAQAVRLPRGHARQMPIPARCPFAQCQHGLTLQPESTQKHRASEGRSQQFPNAISPAISHFHRFIADSTPPHPYNPSEGAQRKSPPLPIL